MIKKNIIIIFLILLLNGCGFTPIYLNKNDVKFSIEQVNFSGDRDLNNFLKMNLDQYKNDKIDNKISIDAKSTYKKIILSKDGTGKVTNYQLEAEVIFLIKSINKEIKIIEREIIDGMDDKFEEARYERTIKQSFASSITNKLTSELIIDK
jgi:outer membrane lipopolysaccharide assembly protein LptE/RlpB